MHKIKKGDIAVAIAGKDKGKQGKVLRVLPTKNRAIVEGINCVKKHLKPNPQRGVTGGIVTKEASIDLANLALYNPITKKADKVKIKTLEDGRRVRVFKSNGELVDI